MRRALLLALTLASALAPSAAQAQLPGGLTSDNVEFVRNLARHTDTAGATLHAGFYYVTTERDLSIYDVKDAENPALVGNVVLQNIGMPIFTEEDPETNGKLLAVSNDGLLIYDVTDKGNPTLIGELPDLEQHTISCVLDCTYLYGSEGAVVDLRDPKAPKLIGNWREDAGVQTTSTHDITEVAPGIVLTSTEPLLVLDVRADPSKPKLLASAKTPGFAHATLWPHGGKDRFALVGGEAVGPQCQDSPSATFMTFDTLGWMGSKTFRPAGEFRMTTGTVADGRQADSTYCVHWFDPHPTYVNGGLVAVAWYEQGTRFLKVDREGKLEEVGYWLPYAGQSSDVDWVSDKVLYVADYLRGVDVLRFTGAVPGGFPFSDAPAPAPAPATTKPAAPARATFQQLVTFPSTKRCVRARSFRVRIRRNAADPVVRATLLVKGRRTTTARGTKALTKGLRVKRLPRGRFAVQVEVVTRSGRRTAGQRTFRACA